MDDIASTKAAADNHLRRLRKERGIKGDDNDISDGVLVSSLDEALNLVSDQLYTTPTHFLLELIQNADDNTYPSGAVPRLHLSLYKKDGKRFFRSDCNEVGFTFRQLDALARIGKSTKKTITGGRKGYIGEKGIGFKSVFKVADVVRVASGCYEFKFDRRETIGMMVPILARFPSDDRVEGHTQVLLQVKRSDDYNQIKNDLEELGSQLLLFIRKLKQLEVSINGKNRAYRCRTKKRDDDFGGGETATISETVDEETKTTQYVIHRQTVEDLPLDPRREGVDTSEVVIAFAVKDLVTPITKTQQVFAFLPIHSYGFPFLIHADFLLTASRESLEYHCSWNLALQKGIQNAVVEAIVKRFADLDKVGDGEGLCYSWPKYLTRQPNGSGFWDTLHCNILAVLRSKKILWSRDRDANLQKPTAVWYVPESYRFQGRTLFNLPSINATHLSFVYDYVHTPLKSIGVSQLSLRALCEEFCQWVGEVGATGLNKKSSEWHNRVGKIFYGEEKWIKEKLKRLPIIPLRDGSWVKATATNLYLPPPNKNEVVPSGVNISVVDEVAARDKFRRKLYEYLEIKEYSPHQACKLILELHGKLAVRWTGRSNEELIADAAYLFKHRYELDNLRDLDIFFAVSKDGVIVPRRSSRIYLVDPTLRHGMISKYKDTPGNPFAVLFNGYEAAILKNGTTMSLQEFRKWLLRSSSRFARTPDLILNSRLTPEWEFLRDQNVVDLLYAIGEKLSTTLYPPPKLLEVVPRLRVRCLDGVSRKLGGLAVPTPDLTRVCPHLDFADLPEPTSDNWKFLSEFGVTVKLDTTARLIELRALRHIPLQDVDASAVRDTYEALNSDADRNKREIVTAFESQPLVFVPKPNPKWLSHDDCVWGAPSPLTRVTKLQGYYRNCEKLFRSLLGVKAAGNRHVVNEFCESISGGDGDMQRRFEALLSLLGTFHCKSRLTDDQLRKIRSASAFPILAKGLPLGEEPVRIEMRSIGDKNWYIPDKVTFEAAFRGKVDLLSLPVQLARSLKDLLEDLRCGDKFLSSAVNRTVNTDGMTVRDIHDEEDLRERLRYISQLAKVDSGPPPNFSSVRVWSVPSIIVKMSLNDVEVIADDELITIDDSEDNIDIYLREAHSDRSTVTFKLVEYFKDEIEIDDKFAYLFHYLMAAPIHSLPGILEEYDIPLPKGFSDDEDASSSEETNGPEDADTLADENDTPSGDSGGNHGSRPNSDVASRENYHALGAALTSMDSDTESSIERGGLSPRTPPVRRTRPTVLQELIPSHQSRTESIIQRAGHFRISDSNAITPVQHHSESRATFHFSLPIRTRINNLDKSEDESLPERPVVARPSYRSSVGVGEGAGAGYYSPTSRRQSSGTTRGSGRPDDTSEIRTREIGFLGELFVYEMFAQQIDDWTFEHWTSSMRGDAGHPRFRGREREFSDFTYVDASGRMRAALRDAGIEPNAAWSDATKFHLEVKGTLGACTEPMFVSQNQVDKMRQFDGTPDHAYILLRVFNLEDGRETGVKFFRDPWSLYMDGVLDFRSDEGYRVYH